MAKWPEPHGGYPCGSAVTVCAGKVLAALGAEEIQQQLSAFSFQNPGVHLDPVVQPGFAHNIEYRTTGSGLLIPGPEHQLWDAGKDNGAGAHRAGSRVTTKVQSSSRQPSSVPRACRARTALRMATTSACAVGSPPASRSLRPEASTCRSGERMTAPMGTSSVASAARASSSASRIHVSCSCTIVSPTLRGAVPPACELGATTVPGASRSSRACSVGHIGRIQCPNLG